MGGVYFTEMEWDFPVIPVTRGLTGGSRRVHLYLFSTLEHWGFVVYAKRRKNLATPLHHWSSCRFDHIHPTGWFSELCELVDIIDINYVNPNGIQRH
jgi:hypothetical protein